MHRALLNKKKGKIGTEKKKTRKEIRQIATQSTDLNTEFQNRSMKCVCVSTRIAVVGSVVQ